MAGPYIDPALFEMLNAKEWHIEPGSVHFEFQEEEESEDSVEEQKALGNAHYASGRWLEAVEAYTQASILIHAT